MGKSLDFPQKKQKRSTKGKKNSKKHEFTTAKREREREKVCVCVYTRTKVILVPTWFAHSNYSS